MRFLLKPTIITYITAAFIIAFTFMTNPTVIGFSSDAVYLPALFSDVFIRGYHFSLWHLTPSPYFFPDMFIFFIIYAFIRNIFYAFLIYAITQSLLLLFLASKIAFFVTKNKSAVLLTHIIFLLTLIFTCFGGVEAYSVVMKSAHHVGAIINGLILILLLLEYKKKQTNGLLLAMFCLSILGVASDLLFIIQFLLPMIVSLILIRILKIQILSIHSMGKFFLAIIMGSVIGFSVKYVFILGNTRDYILPNALAASDATHGIFILFKNAFFHNFLMGLLLVTFYLALIVKLIMAGVNRKNFGLLLKQQKLTLFLLLFVFLSSVFTWGSMAINGHATMRYFLNIFWFPIFFFWLLFGEISSKKILLLALYLISIATLINRLFFHSPFIFNYMPEVVRCVDAQISKYNAEHNKKIKYGISAYWQAKLTTVFSKEKIVISQYTKDLHPRLWITSAENYRDSYDFAILSSDQRLNVDLLEQLNGKPIITFKCNDKISLLIYGKDRLRVPDYEIKQGAV